MVKERTIVSIETPGSYHKTLRVEHLGDSDAGYARFEVRCPGHNVGNAFFNLSVAGAQKLRDALISLFPKVVTAKAATPKGAQEYKGSANHDWESVGREDHSVIRRLRVPGGWLYRVGYTPYTTFVPMPDVVGYKI